jgi:CheY-like chemotaxis protein
MTTTVLVVDDDDEVRDSYVTVLEQEGYIVLAARDGAEGLLAATARRPDVILLDLMMPDMDGFTFRMRQQQAPELATVPIVVVTAYGSPTMAIGMGACGFVLKPPSVNDLVRAIDRATATT